MGTLHWIAGDDEFNVKARARALAAELAGGDFEANPGAELVAADRDDMKFDAVAPLFLDALRTPPFLANEKLVWLRHVPDMDVFSPKEPAGVMAEILEILLNPLPPEVTVLVDGFNFDQRKSFAKKLKSAKAVIEIFSSLKQSDRKYGEERKLSIRELVTQCGKEIEPAAANYLSDTIGGDSGMLSNEIDKLCCYAGDAPRITLADCQAICSRTPQAVSWEFSGAILAGDSLSALRLLDILLKQGEPEMRLIAAVSGEFQRQIQTRQALDELGLKRVGPNTFSAIPSSVKEKFPNNPLLKMHPYRAYKVCESAAECDDTRLVRQLQLIRDANRALVSGGGDRRMVLEQLVLKLTEK